MTYGYAEFEFIAPPDSPRVSEEVLARSYAVVIGVDEYSNGIASLRTAIADAEHFAKVLQRDHYYHTLTITKDVTKPRLRFFFEEVLPHLDSATPNYRLLIYFAGHGATIEEGLCSEGYLLLSDADAKDCATFLSMLQFKQWIDPLQCRHLLVVLDCCFAGAFRWVSAGRNLLPQKTGLHQQRYQRYLRAQVRQALASSAHNQRAMDIVANGSVLGRREDDPSSESTAQHSPFASRLFKGIAGEADFFNQGIVTASALAVYVSQIGYESLAQGGTQQNPILWPLGNHEFGDFIFLVPGQQQTLSPDPLLTADNNPYRGLLPYEKEHWLTFGGRSRALAEIEERIRQFRFIVILGMSGAGKSSVLRAGIVPNSSEWGFETVVGPVRPGKNPLESLRRACIEQGVGDESETFDDAIKRWCSETDNKRLLIAIDQFEEVVTQTPQAYRKPFVDTLWRLLDCAEGQVRIVATLRSDFEPFFETTELADDAFKRYWYCEKDEIEEAEKTERHRARYHLRPMDRLELREAIEKPAEVFNLYFDPPQFVDTVINEVAETPGSLPLLSFALSELFFGYVDSGREDRTLCEDDFEAMGRLSGAIRQRAELEFADLPSDLHRETLQRIVLRMVSVDAGELSRRPVSLQELTYAQIDENERVSEVIDRFVRARLLVKDFRPLAYGAPPVETIEPAHDALIQSWKRLLDWFDAAQQNDLPLRLRLGQAVQRWQETPPANQKRVLWTHESRLTQLHEVLAPGDFSTCGWLAPIQRLRRTLWPRAKIPTTPIWLNQQEITFVQESIQRRAHSARVTFFTVLGTVLAALVVLSIVIWLQQQTLIERERASIEQSGRLAEAALKQLDDDPVGSIELSLAALPDAETERPYAYLAEYALTEAIQRTQEQQRMRISARASEQVGFGNDWIAIGGDGLSLVNRLEGRSGLLAASPPRDSANAGPPPSVLRLSEGSTDRVLWSSTGDLLASSVSQVTVWRSSQLAATYDFKDDVRLSCAAWRPDGGAILLCRDTSIWLWRPDLGQIVFIAEEGDFVNAVAWSPDGSHFIVTTAFSAKVYSLLDRDGKTSFVVLEGHNDDITGAAFVDDERVLTWGRDGVVLEWSRKGEWRHTYQTGTSDQAVRNIVLSAEKDRMAVLYANGVVTVWAIGEEDRYLHLTLSGHSGQAITAAAWIDHFLATGGIDNTIHLWDTNNGHLIVTLSGHESRVNQLAWEADRQHLLSHAQDGTLRWWHVFDGDGRPICAFDTHDQIRCRTLLMTEVPLGQAPVSVVTTAAGQIVAATQQGDIYALDIHSGRLDTLSQAEVRGRDVILADDGRFALSYVPQAKGELWKVDERGWALLREIPGPIARAFWRNGVLILDRNRNQVEVVDLTLGTTTHVALDSRSAIYDLSVAHNQLAVSFTDGAVGLWRLDGNHHITLMDGGSSKPFMHFQWSGDGRRLMATQWFDGQIRAWDTDSGKSVWTSPLAQGVMDVIGPELSPTGRYLAFANDDRLFVIQADNARQVARNASTHGQILGVQWITGRERLLTWESKGNIRIWAIDHRQGELQQVLALLPPSPVDLIGVWTQDDGSTIVGVDENGGLMRWRAWPDLNALIRFAEVCCSFE